MKTELDFHAFLEQKICEKKSPVIVLEGPCASGKTTLAQAIARFWNAQIISMDDFFLQPHQRTPERLAECGGNLDRERFLEEVIHPLMTGKDFSYRPFDCSNSDFLFPVEISREKPIVVEGSYSMHPAFGIYYDLSVFLTVSKEEKMDRLKKRSPNLLSRFFHEWIPMENRYFSEFSVLERCDLVLPASFSLFGQGNS